jgi:protein gp37
MNKTNISYLDFTWNPTHGCSFISAGCQKCWAKRMSKRLAGNNIHGYDKTDPFKPTFCSWAINEPLERKKPAVIGVSFMGDLFHENITDMQHGQIFAEMVLNPQHTFILLSKRPENMLRSARLLKQYHAQSSNHIWFGCSIEDNKTLSRLIDMAALKALGVNTWLSIEPLLEDVSEGLKTALNVNDCIDCFVVGGESGPGARYCDPNWIGNIYNIIPKNKFYFKQWGDNSNYYVDNLKYKHLQIVQSTQNLPWRNK